MSVELTEYKEYTIEIGRDEYPENPRHWDNIGTMICRHNRLSLGDEHSIDFSECNSWNDDENIIKDIFGLDCIMLPLYLYNHSGITMKTTPFSCRFDSGRVGTIVVSRKKARNELNVKRITKNTKNQILKYLEGEVQTYDHYISGNVWYNKILKDGEEIDSCYGYYGEDTCLSEAKHQVDHIVLTEQKKTGIQMELDLTVDINKMELAA